MYGTIAGLILTFCLGLENLFYSTGMLWKLWVVAFLTFGIYIKSRLAASLLLIYFVEDQLLSYPEVVQTPFNILFTLLVGFGLLKGVWGTFIYYKFKDNSE